MNHDLPLRIPTSVMHEIFDDEVVVVNLQSGAYFSLRGLALELWTQIETGATPTELVETLRERPPGDTDRRGEIQTWLDALRTEGLIEAAWDTLPGGADDGLQERLAHTPFAGTMEKFTDVEGLLMLDPIHEVDDAGWPKATGDRTP